MTSVELRPGRNDLGLGQTDLGHINLGQTEDGAKQLVTNLVTWIIRKSNNDHEVVKAQLKKHQQHCEPCNC